MTRPAPAAWLSTGRAFQGSAHRGGKSRRIRKRRGPNAPDTIGCIARSLRERRMKTVFRIILAITSLLAVQHVVAQIVFYEQEWFRGRTFAANGTVNNLEGTGFNDRASSAIVESGALQICEEAYFGGACLILRPGPYGSLG